VPVRRTRRNRTSNLRLPRRLHLRRGPRDGRPWHRRKLLRPRPTQRSPIDPSSRAAPKSSSRRCWKNAAFTSADATCTSGGSSSTSSRGGVRCSWSARFGRERAHAMSFPPRRSGGRSSRASGERRRSGCANKSSAAYTRASMPRQLCSTGQAGSRGWSTTKTCRSRSGSRATDTVTVTDADADAGTGTGTGTGTATDTATDADADTDAGTDTDADADTDTDAGQPASTCVTETQSVGPSSPPRRLHAIACLRNTVAPPLARRSGVRLLTWRGWIRRVRAFGVAAAALL